MALKELFPTGQVKNAGPFEVTMVFNNKDTRFGTTNKLRLFIREFGLDGKKSKDKFIPKQIFNLSKEKISLFLKTLFSCDGSVYIKKSREKAQAVVEYDSISKNLIYGISMLLLRFGIQHTITNHKFRGDPNYSFRISIYNQEQIRKYIEEIGFIGKKQKIALDVLSRLKIHKFTNLDKVPRIIRSYLKNKGFSYNELDRYLNYEEIENLRKKIGFKKIRKYGLVKSPCVFKQGKIDFLRSHLKKVNEYVKDDVLSLIGSEFIVWDKIKSIKYAKDDITYDLEVPEYHNFIANGIIVHNSAIALNIAKELGRASIVVPVKALQKQYADDYLEKKYLLKENGEKLKIKVITGRQNFECPFLKERKDFDLKREKNAKIEDFFKKAPEKEEKQTDMSSCDNPFIPCKVELKDKNFRIIRQYLKENPRINLDYFTDMAKVRRLSIAPICPYWSPIVPAELNIEALKDAARKDYSGLNGKKLVFYQRKPGCGYYDQYQSYIDADVLIFNSLKYKLETFMDRKPETEVEIIDECDEFLDSFSNQEKINLSRLSMALSSLFAEEEGSQTAVIELAEIVSNILTDEKTAELAETGAIVNLKETKIIEILKRFLDSGLMSYVECDEENYCYHADKVARIFENFLDETYVSFHKEEKNVFVRLVTTNLEKRFKELLEKNKAIIMMSGTIHSDSVLKDIFGITDFKIIEAETKMPGKVLPLRTGCEINCKYENFRTGKYTRKQYLQALNASINAARKPVLVHVNSFGDLPSEQEVKEFGLNMMTRQQLFDIQDKDKQGENVQRFKKGEISILYSTKCNRGADFPGSVCNSVVLTKYPYPNISSLFWEILKKTNPEHYHSFYIDKSKREFLQRIYRAVRSESDSVSLLSPDIRCFMGN